MSSYVEIEGLGKLFLNPNDLGPCKMLSSGIIYEKHLHKYFNSYILKGSTVIDVGAFIGSHTIKMSSLVEGGVVYAFEPNKVSFNYLCDNIKLNGITNTFIYNYGVSSACGYMYIDSGGSIRNYSSTYLTDCGDESQKVEVRTIDSFDLKNVSLIKIDVEGNEMNVLLGAVITITIFRPVVILEINKRADREPFNKWFNSINYVIKSIGGRDSIAIPKEKI